MAIKAGRVGVNPSQVDMAGNIVTSGDESYTKTEADAKFATKTETASLATKASLTANGKEFTFAYDESTQKYGYKLDGTGEFNPFDKAGGSPGWNKPADLITTGLTVNQFIEITSGGYYDDGDNIFVDIIVKQLSAGGGRVMGLPKAPSSTVFVSFKDSTIDNISDLYVFDGTHVNVSVIAVVEGSSSYLNLQSNQGIGNYVHIFGAYTKI